MVWILLATLLVSVAFFLVVFRQVSHTEERLRNLVVRAELSISKKFGAKLIPPGKATDDSEEEEE